MNPDSVSVFKERWRVASDCARPAQQNRVDAYAALSRCARFCVCVCLDMCVCICVFVCAYVSGKHRVVVLGAKLSILT